MSRPYSGCYASLRTHAADIAAMRSLIDGDGDLDGYCHADDPRCPVCKCWLGYGETDWCADCQFGDDR
jgi:hypothetical protein